MCSGLFHTLGFLNLNGYPVSHRSAKSKAGIQCFVLFFTHLLIVFKTFNHVDDLWSVFRGPPWFGTHVLCGLITSFNHSVKYSEYSNS